MNFPSEVFLKFDKEELYSFLGGFTVGIFYLFLLFLGLNFDSELFYFKFNSPTDSNLLLGCLIFSLGVVFSGLVYGLYFLLTYFTFLMTQKICANLKLPFNHPDLGNQLQTKKEIILPFHILGIAGSALASLLPGLMFFKFKLYTFSNFSFLQRLFLYALVDLIILTLFYICVFFCISFFLGIIGTVINILQKATRQTT